MINSSYAETTAAAAVFAAKLECLSRDLVAQFIKSGEPYQWDNLQDVFHMFLCGKESFGSANVAIGGMVTEQFAEISDEINAFAGDDSGEFFDAVMTAVRSRCIDLIGNLSPKAKTAITALLTENAVFTVSVGPRSKKRTAHLGVPYASGAMGRRHLAPREDGFYTVRGVGIAEFDELQAAGHLQNLYGSNAYKAA